MSELSFLIDLLMNHKLSKATKDLISARIKEVEAKYVTSVHIPASAQIRIPTVGNLQAASTLAAMARHGEIPQTVIDPPPKPEPVEVIAQTPATAQAMQSRQQAIAESIAGKIDKVTGRPRKW